MRFIISLFLIFSVVTLKSNGQQLSRISCDFSVKTKIKGKSNARLVMGTCYYDIRVGRMVYDIKFPEKERWIFIDSVQWIIRNDTVVSVEASSLRPELSVLHLSLTQDLSHYGLKNSMLKPVTVEQAQGAVITTWEPPPAAKKKIGKVATSVKNKQLQGVLFYHPSGKLLRKQLFAKYKNVSGLYFPTEVIDIVIEEQQEIWQQTNYSNIIINGTQNDALYSYLPRNFPASKKPNLSRH
jgi:hypothetical protein